MLLLLLLLLLDARPPLLHGLDHLLIGDCSKSLLLLRGRSIDLLILGRIDRKGLLLLLPLLLKQHCHGPLSGLGFEVAALALMLGFHCRHRLRRNRCRALILCLRWVTR